jgi:hypothetical protein
VPDRDGPLSILGRKLRSRGPPSLSTLVARLAEVEDYAFFVAIVRDLLPEREDEIIRELTPGAQIAAFASHFEDRYFPLEETFKIGDAETYSDLTRGIPIILSGISYDDYHEIASDWRPGFQLMAYIVADPYMDETRVALAEACAQHVPADILQQVPEEGLSTEECHRILDQTPHKALAQFADILWTETENFFLDACYEDLWNWGIPDWDRETVDNLTQKWQQAEMIYKEVTNLATWLEEDPPGHFEELLNLILERRG